MRGEASSGSRTVKRSSKSSTMSSATSPRVASCNPKSSNSLSSGMAADKSNSKFLVHMSRNQITESKGMPRATPNRRCHSSCVSAGRRARKRTTSSRRSGLGSYGIRNLSAILRMSLRMRVASRLMSQISDPASLISDCQPERHRRVRCIWLGGLYCHVFVFSLAEKPASFDPLAFPPLNFVVLRVTKRASVKTARPRPFLWRVPSSRASAGRGAWRQLHWRTPRPCRQYRQGGDAVASQDHKPRCRS
jgi:hypothetical protein